MSAPLTLAARLDSPNARLLAEELKSRRGSEICIDGSGVAFCGAMAMQTLISARLQWKKDEHSFVIENPSDDLEDACRLLGVSLKAVGIIHGTGDNQ